MRKALVLGVNGQDGSYLAEGLLRRGYEVTGIGRQQRSRHIEPTDFFHYVAVDLADASKLDAVLRHEDFDLVFHVAAVHGSSGFSYEPIWRNMMEVNVLALHVLLEHARLRRPDMRIIYANSAKVFPEPLAGTIDECTARAATCLYSIGKIASANLIDQYRDRHRIPASNLYLFNHESVRRGADFFVPKVARCLATALRHPAFSAELQTLNFRADWSAASELMDIAIDVAERAPNRDLVLASGHTWYAREAVEMLFQRYGLDYRGHFREAAPSRELPPDFRVSLNRLKAAIGRGPVRHLCTIVDEMLAYAGVPASTIAAAAPIYQFDGTPR